MAKGKRVTPFKRRARGGGKRDEIIEDLDERLAEVEMIQAGIDTKNIANRLALMTAEQMAETQQVAAQNALRLFNEMLEEVRRRIPTMEDERIVNALLAIWDKTGGKK
jgi:tryptophan synthase beta subunit